jgi:hypothetical protein
MSMTIPFISNINRVSSPMNKPIPCYVQWCFLTSLGSGIVEGLTTSSFMIFMWTGSWQFRWWWEPRDGEKWDQGDGISGESDVSHWDPTKEIGHSCWSALENEMAVWEI